MGVSVGVKTNDSTGTLGGFVHAKNSGTIYGITNGGICRAQYRRTLESLPLRLGPDNITMISNSDKDHRFLLSSVQMHYDECAAEDEIYAGASQVLHDGG